MRQSKQRSSEAAFSILTLDDDQSLTSTVQHYFQRCGYRVDVENDPIQAIERIRNGSYDILLLDYFMTPIDGNQVVEQVRQFNQDIFIILLTGQADKLPPVQTIRSLDIQGYFEKSPRYDQLELLVESCVKSIRQMRTIRGYKDGLSAIVDSLPAIYSLHSSDHMADSVLHTAASLLPYVSLGLVLDVSDDGHPHFVSRTVGEYLPAPSDERVFELLREVEGRTSLLKDKRLMLPILGSNQRTMGLLVVDLKESPRPDQVLLMEAFVRQAAAAMGNAKLHALVQKQHLQLDQAYQELKQDYFEMVSAMRRIVDAKDIYTRGHSDRVSSYAVQIARHMGKDTEYCQQIHTAGLFHDVGKLSIPDEILLKNGKLTDEEYEVIKTHPSAGADILAHITQFHPLLPAVRSHHERFDGRGYPDGLQGLNIPEMARIIAVADSFDAMTSNRQYRNGLGFQRAIDELKRCSGTQFDPHVVEAFLELALTDGFEERMWERTESLDPIDPSRNHSYPKQEATV